MAKIAIDNLTMYYGASVQLHEFARQLRNNPTLCEQLLWNKLSDRSLFSYKFRRQHPIHYFIADFYCHQAKLIVEVDGGIHLLDEQYEYDVNRDYELREFGLTVLRFTNQQVLSNIDLIAARILSFIDETISSSEKAPNHKSPLGDLGVF